MTAEDAKKKLRSLASPELAKSSARFFKTGPVQYGEGDIFIGIKVPTLRKLARDFLDRGNLIHKATGWMLREVGKKHEPTLIGFLEGHGTETPRTMFRYAIVRFSPEKKQYYLLKM